MKRPVVIGLVAATALVATAAGLFCCGGASERFCAAPEASARTGMADSSSTQRWASRTISYSFAPDDVIVAFAPNIAEAYGREQNSLYGTMNGWFETEEQWKNVIRGAFEEWESKTGLKFIEVPDDGSPFDNRGNSGQIRFFARGLGGPKGVYADALPPPFGQIRFDSEEVWNGKLLHLVALHEIGHALGLVHACPRDGNKVMEDNLGAATSVRENDLRCIHSLYGDEFEDVDKNTTSVTPDRLERADLSIVRQGSYVDVDNFSVELPAGTMVQVTVSPVGTRYRVAPASETCGGDEVDAAAQLRLRLEALGVTSQAGDSDLGRPVAVSVKVPPDGRVFLRIGSVSDTATNAVQRYKVRIE